MSPFLTDELMDIVIFLHPLALRWQADQIPQILCNRIFIRLSISFYAPLPEILLHCRWFLSGK